MKARSYHCTDEELLVIGNRLSESLKRDLKDFASLSPQFDEGYVMGVDDKIGICTELMSPESEIVMLKTATTRLHETMRNLRALASKLSIYLKLAKADAPLTAAEFGLTKLFRKIRSRDVDSMLRQLRVVTDNLHTYHKALVRHGMPEAFPKQLNAAALSINADKQKQLTIVNARSELMQANMEKMNDLYEIMKEISRAGKLLYRKTDAVKAQDYILRELLKKVRADRRAARAKGLR
ncbi:MAG: hypothetical protein LBP64_01505 [Tannerella sp.]|jgi:hypothetical protein|nr:hypothetical protein [Tannerella sp.]